MGACVKSVQSQNDPGNHHPLLTLIDAILVVPGLCVHCDSAANDRVTSLFTTWLF